jgi:Spy/CpxP family protein refolding chaperone
MKVCTRFLKPLLLAGFLAAPLAAFAFGGEHCEGAMMHGDGGMMHGDGDGEMGMGGHHGMPPFIHQLKLSDAQRDQIFKLMHDQAPALRDKAKEARKAHEELQGLAFSAQYDEARVKALTESAARSMAEMMQMRLAGANQIYLLLTPEQRKKADELKADFAAHGPHGGPRGPEARGAKRG